jgi:hypothetical protein
MTFIGKGVDVMKIMKVLSISILFILLTACKDNQEHSEKASLEPIKVEIITPNRLAIGKTVNLQIKVTQSNENVDDADEVEFEIWKDDDRSHSDMASAKNIGEGIYEVKKSFKEEGTYSIQTHVTARSMHSMPTKQVVVENAKKKETE